jgi:hypothetical protein
MRVNACETIFRIDPKGFLKPFGSGLLSLVILMLFLVGCSAAPVSGGVTATPVIVRETVVFVVTATSPPATAAAVPTATSAASAATATATNRPVAVKPTPTPLLLANIPIEGGDPNNMFFAHLIFPQYQPAATNSLWFQVQAHKPSSSKVDGEGIATVDFLITDSNGKRVHFREEKTAKFCSFGGGEPDCTILDFASSGYKWPDGGKIVNGNYTITVTVTAKDGTVMFGSANFRIQVP